ncbi:MAG: hypothetical protein VB118_04730 [Oscillospiraceae bacterium]|nr:hypothetical protein [Oscillospiraceae bacterium]
MFKELKINIDAPISPKEIASQLKIVIAAFKRKRMKQILKGESKEAIMETERIINGLTGAYSLTNKAAVNASECKYYYAVKDGIWYCSSCGKETKDPESNLETDKVKFCSYCGHRVTDFENVDKKYF